MGLGPHRFFWKAIWKLDTLPKIWVFTWQVGHEILPTNGLCLTRAIQSIGGLNNSLILKEYHCCIDWLEDMMRVLDKRATFNLMTTLWNSWNNRNKFIFHVKEEEAQVVWDRARTLSQDFCIFNLMNAPLLPSNPAIKRWLKPPKGYFKINFDASVSNNRTDLGVITRDEDDFVIGNGGGFKEEIMLIARAESYAFDESIKIVCVLNIQIVVVFETNKASLITSVKHHCTDVIVIGVRIKESIKL
ncbi:hypothetical protein PVK06_017153 [Gossypium arboreum]|uniref:Reverse transcriptase zinc-binding domain-containing protein n=1 Tax=Gossypium arboreum TaxID=29729 RepID=A0ABR0Q2F5_GOSAR|nr:hypothetical protein PVK06_017153 [Gossypium arboreum]